MNALVKLSSNFMVPYPEWTIVIWKSIFKLNAKICTPEIIELKDFHLYSIYSQIVNSLFSLHTKNHFEFKEFQINLRTRKFSQDVKQYLIQMWPL